MLRRIAPFFAFLMPIGLLVFSFSKSTSGGTVDPQPPTPPPQACFSAPHDQLCSALPHDITNDFGFGYGDLAAATQRPFDNFSWQSFVALNWPANDDGTPSTMSILSAPNRRRVWEFYKNPFDDLFSQQLPGENHAPLVLRQKVRAAGTLFVTMAATRTNLKPSSFLEATIEAPLIDRNLNFVVYDIRINQLEYDYIKTNQLNTIQGQRTFKDLGKEVNFPKGSYQDPVQLTGGSVGAIEIKTAWRILDARKDKREKYYTTPATIYIDADHSESGEPLLIHATLGLVGFHIIQRTDGPPHSPADWIWSTFEHVDNAPLADNARDPTNFTPPLPPVATPPLKVDRLYSFYNPDYDGPTNAIPQLNPGETTYLWTATPPYARRYALRNRVGAGAYGTQVVRCWKVFPATEEVNKYFQKLLHGTVWQNYQLIGTQWMGANDTVNPAANGNVPRYLSNTALETYIQFDQQLGSCLVCHGNAGTKVPGLSGNFSFLLARAR